MVAIGLLLATGSAWAQDSGRLASPEFGHLQDTLKSGDSIIVSIGDGTKAEGRLLDVSPSQIAMLVNGTRREIPSDQVARVQRRRNGILLGALIGAGAGVPFGIFLREYAYNEAGNEAAALMFPIAVGLGAGVAIDALLVRPRTVYERRPTTRSHVSFLVGPRWTGASMTIVF